MFDFISIGETLLAFLQEDTSLWLSWCEQMVGSTTKGPTSAPDHHDLPSLISSVTSMAWTADSTGDFQHSETSKSCSFLLWLLFFVATFKKWLGLCAQWWSSVLLCPKRCGENQTYLPILLRHFLHLESRRWLGNEGHSETEQRKKVSDSFPWHWKNSTDECTLFSLRHTAWEKNPTGEPPRVSKLSDGLCLREDALTGTDVITNDL